MDSGWPIELPRPQIHAAIGRRRHRRLTTPSGLILLVCLFLPAVRACDNVVYPIETPYFWHPYIYGGALAIAALATTMRAVRLATTAMRGLAYVSIAGGCLLMVGNPAFGGIELALGVSMLAIIGTQGVSERRMALTGIVMAVLSLLWFGLWAGSASALVGVYVALAASIFLLAGSLLWLSEI